MAVNSARKFGRASLIAAVMASVALPGLAMAEPGWRGRGGGESRSEQVGDNRGGGRQGGWQQQPPQQQAPQQRQQQAPQQRQGGWQPQTQAPPQAQAPAPRQQGGWQQQGGQRADRQDGDGGNNWRGRRDDRQQQQSQQQQGGWQQQGGQRAERDGRGDNGNWRGRRDDQQQQSSPSHWGGNRQDGGSWSDGQRRDGRTPSARTGHWNPRDHSRVDRRDRHYRGGYYHNGYYYGHSGDYYWDHRWRNNRRYDWNTYRRSHPSYFQVGIYYSPYRNYRYQRLSVGWFLDELFFGNRYWINDPWRYRLPDVYEPYRWVRYYNDAVLVDLYTGEVVDVIYDFFW